MTDPAADSPELPDGLELVRTTDVFDEHHHPGGLLRAHRVADGVWGRLVVHSGHIGFVFEDRADRPLSVGAGDHVVIPPARLHHVEFDGPVTFAIEFHREPETANPAVGSESTGLQP